MSIYVFLIVTRGLNIYLYTQYTGYPLKMSTKQQIEQKLQQGINLSFFEVVNESDMHNVPPGSESHFKITLVSDEFSGKNLLAQHRMVNALLADELDIIHALAIHTYTPEEWSAKQGVSPDSPQCLGGGK